MIVDKNITQFVVFPDDSLSFALHKITANKSGFVFVVSQNGVLEGLLTDGDFRRWLLETRNWDLLQPVSIATNRQFISMDIDSPVVEIEALFSEKINIIPLLDKKKRLFPNFEKYALLTDEEREEKKVSLSI